MEGVLSMQDFSTMAKSMQNIASPGKMPPPTMQGRGPMVGPPPGPGAGAPPMGLPPAPQPPGSGDQIMQMIQQIAQQIEATTGVPATPEQIQAALAQVMPGMGAGAEAAPPGMGTAPAAPGGAQPMIPPQTTMKR